MPRESRIRRALAEPRTAMAVLVALVRGHLIKIHYGLTNPRVKIGPDFRAYCWLRIRGPGRVTLGRNVSVSRGFQRIPTIVTHVNSSTVSIGNGCDISGARISCARSIEVGDRTLFASTTLIDTDLLPALDIETQSSSVVSEGQPIVIGSSCWLGMNSFVLRGCRLGDAVVVAAGAVIRETEAKDGAMLLGNPARQVQVSPK